MPFPFLEMTRISEVTIELAGASTRSVTVSGSQLERAASPNESSGRQRVLGPRNRIHRRSLAVPVALLMFPKSAMELTPSRFMCFSIASRSD